MKDDEIKEFVNAICTNPDFLRSLQTFYENHKEGSIDINTLALWFFSKGYLSCLEYQENKDKFRSISYEELRKVQEYF